MDNYCNPPMPIGCEFCNEFVSPQTSRFGQIYGDTLESRIVFSRNGCVALPTIGQLFPGTLLVMPVEHFETFAGAPTELREALCSIIKELSDVVRRLGFPFLVEHGAKQHTGASCGIYHAHAHLIPLPEHVEAGFLLPHTNEKAIDLESALLTLRSGDNYLLCQDSSGTVSFSKYSEENAEYFSSQYVRRRLAKYFQLSADWDWRNYIAPEAALIQAVQLLG